MSLKFSAPEALDTCAGQYIDKINKIDIKKISCYIDIKKPCTMYNDIHEYHNSDAKRDYYIFFIKSQI